jgi:hypothetical protein
VGLEALEKRKTSFICRDTKYGYRPARSLKKGASRNWLWWVLPDVSKTHAAYLSLILSSQAE